MNCVLFAKMDQVFSKENKTLKKNTGKLEKKYWKSQGILSVRKSGNPDPPGWRPLPLWIEAPLRKEHGTRQEVTS